MCRIHQRRSKNEQDVAHLLQRLQGIPTFIPQVKSEPLVSVKGKLCRCNVHQTIPLSVSINDKTLHIGICYWSVGIACLNTKRGSHMFTY